MQAVTRAYSVLEVKAVDAEKRIVTGIATTPEVDRMGDVVQSSGASFKNPLPLLLHHDSRLPVGTVKLQKPTDEGIRFEAKLPVIDEPGTLKDRVEEAWASIKNGLIRGVSIGFRALEDGVELMKSGGIRFTDFEILELSLVAIPANQSARIEVIRSIDAAHLAASGNGSGRNTSGDSDACVVVRVNAPTRKAAMKKTYTEQIEALEAKRAALEARRDEIQSKAMDEGRTKDESEKEEFTSIGAELKAIDEELVDLRDLEKSNRASAKPVAGETVEKASAARGGNHVITVNDPKLPPGIGFARAVKATLVAKIDGRNALDIAKEMYPSDQRLHKHIAHVQALPNIVAHMRAAVPGANIDSGSLWAGALVDPTNLPGEFIEFLRPATIIGRLNLRSIPTNVRLIEQTQGGTGYWVGVGAPKPLTAFGYAPVTLGPTKVAAIAVASEESLRYSSPSLDMLIRDGLRDCLVERVDKDLLDPAEAGSTNVQPASLTNGLTALTSAGTSADNARTDLANLVQALRSQNLRGSIAIVLPDSLLTGLAFMVNSLGQPEFPGLDSDGGSYKGIRFISSEYVANPSGYGNMVVAIAEREVFRSDDGGVRVDASREASLQMLDNPTNNSASATPTTMVSMWQTNSVAFRGEWFINWQKRRPSAVAYMDDVNWGSVGSPA